MIEIQWAPPPPSPGALTKPRSPTATKGSELELPQPAISAVAWNLPAPWELFPAPCPHLDPSAPTVCKPWRRNIGAAATAPTPRPLPTGWFPRLCWSSFQCQPGPVARCPQRGVHRARQPGAGAAPRANLPARLEGRGHASPQSAHLGRRAERLAINRTGAAQTGWPSS
jgi:hypothetical protein